jgi:hypothetical protein
MLGQALQSGNLSAAQQAYATMRQDLRQYAQTNALPTESGTSGISSQRLRRCRQWSVARYPCCPGRNRINESWEIRTGLVMREKFAVPMTLLPVDRIVPDMQVVCLRIQRLDIRLQQKSLDEVAQSGHVRGYRPESLLTWPGFLDYGSICHSRHPVDI